MATQAQIDAATIALRTYLDGVVLSGVPNLFQGMAEDDINKYVGTMAVTALNGAENVQTISPEQKS